ncbi:O-antigen ligase family protein [Poriferisphaera corsica]|nr:hypothetical protein [Poriferisphaera corsica]
MKESLFFSAPFFSSPLFVAIGGPNSFVYLFDLFVPFLIVSAVKQYRNATVDTKRMFWVIMLLAGLIPLLSVFVSNPTHSRFIRNTLINTWRVGGGMCLFLLAATCRFKVKGTLQRSFSVALLPMAVFTIFIFIAAFLQYKRYINANLLYGLFAGTFGSNEETTHALSVAGLFRGSMGIMGALAICTIFCIKDAKPFENAIAVAGALAGIGLILLSGSKTSLVIAVGIAGLNIFRLKSIGIKQTFYLGVAGFIGFFSLPMLLVMLPQKAVERTLAVFSGETFSAETFLTRMHRWTAAFERFQEFPAVFMGINPVSPDIETIGFYHNDWIGLLMHGGVFNLVLYIVMIWMGLFYIWRWRGRPNVMRSFGFFVIANLFVQGFSVSGLLPGYLFVSTVAFQLMYFGFVFNMQSEESLIAEDASVSVDEKETERLRTIGAAY